MSGGRSGCFTCHLRIGTYAHKFRTYPAKGPSDENGSFPVNRGGAKVWRIDGTPRGEGGRSGLQRRQSVLDRDQIRY